MFHLPLFFDTWAFYFIYLSIKILFHNYFVILFYVVLCFLYIVYSTLLFVYLPSSFDRILINKKVSNYLHTNKHCIALFILKDTFYILIYLSVYSVIMIFDLCSTCFFSLTVFIVIIMHSNQTPSMWKTSSATNQFWIFLRWFWLKLFNRCWFDSTITFWRCSLWCYGIV